MTEEKPKLYREYSLSDAREKITIHVRTYIDQQYINGNDRVATHKLWTILTCDARQIIEIVDRVRPTKHKTSDETLVEYPLNSPKIIDNLP